MKALAIFWLCVLTMLGAGAGALQVMGPPHASAPGSVVQPPLKVTARAASAPPSAANPAPPLKMTLGAIPEPDPALQEAATDLDGRMLPRIGPAGRHAGELYAAAFDPAERHPRIAVVIDGAGLDRTLTAQANRLLPAAIDFAYSAYAPEQDSARLAQDGRAAGRECLLSIPMEPNGFPANEEGARSLLTGADPAQTRQNLDWALSGVQGCVGATGASDGMGGERFAETGQAYADMLDAVAARGLIYLDPRPGAAMPAGTATRHLPPYVADVVIDHGAGPDGPADAEAIDRNLAALERVAARSGAAIGLAGPITPVLLDRLAVWSHGLAARGLVLAPLSAIAPPRPVAPAINTAEGTR